MWELEYERMLDRHGADKIAIPEGILECILDRLDEVAEIERLKERVSAVLHRLAKGGRYSHIAYDPHAGVYVFIKIDGSREAVAPLDLDRLFTPPPRRLQLPAFRLVR